MIERIFTILVDIFTKICNEIKILEKGGKQTKFEETQIEDTIHDIPTILVLFIKANSIVLIDTIKKNNSLYIGAESTLFTDTFKMWAGTEKQYNSTSVNVKDEFNRAESKDSFVKEYDYIAMRFQLTKDYNGYYKEDDSYERNQFFTEICKDNVELIECSKRLSFDENLETDAYDIY